jgi:hypothetical protein
MAVRDSALNRSGHARPWSTLPRHVREDFRRDARAALQAARDYADGLLTLSETNRRVAAEDAERAKQPSISERARHPRDKHEWRAPTQWRES